MSKPNSRTCTIFIFKYKTTMGVEGEGYEWCDELGTLLSDIWGRAADGLARHIRDGDYDNEEGDELQSMELMRTEHYK